MPSDRDRSRTVMTLAAILTFSSLAVIGAQEPPAGVAPPRLTDVADPPSNSKMLRIRRVDPAAPVLPREPAPDSVAVRVAGKVQDLNGRPLAGATVDLIGTRIRDVPRMVIVQAVAGTATTGADGLYTILDAKVPTSAYTKSPGTATPFVEFKVVARAKGFGLGWHPGASMYAVGLPYPDDIQGRLPLDSLSTFEMKLRPEADLMGRVVDEFGKPVAGVTVQVRDIDLLDEQGHETVFTSNFDPTLLSDRFGMAETDDDGRFRIPGLPSESCCWLYLGLKGTSMKRALYASTSAPSKTTHEEPPTQRHNGRGRHEVYPAEMTLTVARPRRLEVFVVAGDDGKPVPDVSVHSMGDTLATGVVSGGTTDAQGKVTLDLPPGEHQGLYADPMSTDSRFIRTTLKPLLVVQEPATQRLTFRMTPGVELRLTVVDGTTGRPLPGISFEVRNKAAGSWSPVRSSTFLTGEDQTDADGKFRAVMTPLPVLRVWVRPVLPPAPPGGIAPYQLDDRNGVAFEPRPGASVPVRFALIPR